MTPRRVAAWLLATALIAACAAGPGARRAAEDERRRDLKNDISMLDSQIKRDRQQAGLSLNPGPRWLEYWGNRPLASKPPAKPQSDQCVNACDLAEYICQAAEDICRIAGELGDDDWANEKCSSAKASCAEARQNCKDCVAAEQR